MNQPIQLTYGQFLLHSQNRLHAKHILIKAEPVTDEAGNVTDDGMAAALLRQVCQEVDVNVQTYCNRADLPGGSTLGNISLGHVSIPTADIGLPQLAMHSSYETAAVADALALEKAMTAYYGKTLEVTEQGFTLN